MPRWQLELPRWQFQFPWWDFLLAYPASRHLSIRVSAKGRAAGGRPPFVERRAKAAALMDGCLEAG